MPCYDTAGVPQPPGTMSHMLGTVTTDGQSPQSPQSPQCHAAWLVSKWFRGASKQHRVFFGFPKFPGFPKLRFHIDDETARQVQWQDVEESGARAMLGRWTVPRCHVSPPRSEAKSARFGAVLYGGDSCGYGSLASKIGSPTGGQQVTNQIVTKSDPVGCGIYVSYGCNSGFLTERRCWLFLEFRQVQVMNTTFGLHARHVAAWQG